MEWYASIPPREDVLSAAKSAKGAGVDLLVTVGGGSLTDGAKQFVCVWRWTYGQRMKWRNIARPESWNKL